MAQSACSRRALARGQGEARWLAQEGRAADGRESLGQAGGEGVECVIDWGVKGSESYAFRYESGAAQCTD